MVQEFISEYRDVTVEPVRQRVMGPTNADPSGNNAPVAQTVLVRAGRIR